MKANSRVSKPRRAAKQLISIRLGKDLLHDLKIIARLRGVRYQTLINEVLETEAGHRMKVSV